MVPRLCRVCPVAAQSGCPIAIIRKYTLSSNSSTVRNKNGSNSELQHWPGMSRRANHSIYCREAPSRSGRRATTLTTGNTTRNNRHLHIHAVSCVGFTHTRAHTRRCSHIRAHIGCAPNVWLTARNWCIQKLQNVFDNFAGGKHSY